MKFEIVPAHQISIAEQAKIFTDAFAGYLIGSIALDTAGLSRFLCGQGADLCFSRFVRNETGELTGFGYINRTGNVPRLAGMGTVPGARRSGVAGLLLSHLFDEAKTRGDETMVLECFEQNAPALALYRQHKFEEVIRLFGWRGRGNTNRGFAQLQEISLTRAIYLPTMSEYPELPWQISRFAISKIPGARAFSLGDACVILGDSKSTPVRIHAFLGFAANNWKPVRNVLDAVLAKFPGVEFLAPQVFPEQFGTEIFEPLGFKREPLNQFLMRKNL